MNHGNGPSFADVFVGVEPGQTYGALGEHDMGGFAHASYADAIAVSLFLGAALDHGGPADLSGFSTSSPGSLPGFHGLGAGVDPSNSDWARPVKLPGIAGDTKAVTVLEWPHAECDPQTRVQQAAREMALEHYEYHANGIRNVEATLRGIRRMPSSWPRHKDLWDEHAQPVDDTMDPLKRPSGWYKGATGTTHFWRECYQPRPTLGWLLPRSQREREKWRRTFLMISGATWRYSQVDDCETLIVLSVVSYPFVESGVFVHDRDEIRVYRSYAEQLAEKIASYLRLHFASPEARRRRLDMAINRPEKP